MTAVSLDWEDKGPGGSSTEQASAYIGTGNGLAATVMQERQASYMYIMPQEHLSSKDSPEVRSIDLVQSSIRSLGWTSCMYASSLSNPLVGSTSQ